MRGEISVIARGLEGAMESVFNLYLHMGAVLGGQSNLFDPF